jgi:hypothetical protein
MVTKTERHALEELDHWDDAISALDGALGNASAARDEVNHVAEEMDLIAPSSRPDHAVVCVGPLRLGRNVRARLTSSTRRPSSGLAYSLSCQLT